MRILGVCTWRVGHFALLAVGSFISVRHKLRAEPARPQARHEVFLVVCELFARYAACGGRGV